MIGPDFILARRDSRAGTVLLLHLADPMPGFFPLLLYAVQLPSGMRHGFESEQAARDSQYWPGR